MAEHDWKDLLDDPEVERIIGRVYNGPGRRYYGKSNDALALDDLESWLWDRAVDIAMRYDVSHMNVYDAKRFWYANLHKELAMTIRKNNHYGEYYGKPESSKRRAQIQHHLSVEDQREKLGDYFAHKLAGDDPLTILLRIEALQERVCRAESRYHRPVERDGFCSEPICRSPAHTSGLCSRHYQQLRERWLTDSCSVDGCTEPVRARSLCSRHYQQVARTTVGDCAAEGCTNRVIYKAAQLCARHHQEHKAKAPAQTKHSHCTVPGCDRPHRAKGMCLTHYQQDRRQQRREARNG